jgi:hypothetical protein
MLLISLCLLGQIVKLQLHVLQVHITEYVKMEELTHKMKDSVNATVFQDL